MTTPREDRWTPLRRGLRRRCPHCGRGRLFVKWIELRERCAVCGLRYLRNQGDVWGFLVFVDRGCYLFPLLVAVYFGFFGGRVWLSVAIFGLVALVFVATTPHRYGLCVALDYLTRRRWPDPADPLPPHPDPASPDP